MTARLTVSARARDTGEVRIFETRGQTTKTLLALVAAGSDGCAALEVATWAYRVAAYYHELRRNYGLAIRCDRENHPDGWYGRHILETPIEIIAVEDAEGIAA